MESSLFWLLNVLTECSPVEISQVLLNLMTNSVDAIAENRPNNPYIKLSNRFEGQLLKISIEDNGPGIPNELVSKVMDPFFTTKKVGMGTGLGLSIIGKIVENHGGSFELESNQSPTRFTITIPSQASEETPEETA